MLRSGSRSEIKMSCFPELNCVLADQEVQEGWFCDSQVNGRGGATMEHVV